jgi:hypothetical protein
MSLDYLLQLLSENVLILRRIQQDTIINVYFILVCLTTGPKPLPKRALHIVRSRASSFKRE